MSSAIQKSLGSYLNISFFAWNISPAWTALNGSCVHLYLPKIHADILGMKNFHLMSGYDSPGWHYECKVMYKCKLRKISLVVGPMYTGLISVWFSHLWQWHNLPFPLCLGTSTKLLHHSDVLSIPKGTIIGCFFAIGLTHPWRAVVMCMPYLFEVPSMVWHHLWPAKMVFWNSQFLWIHIWFHCVWIVLSQYLLAF